VSGRCWEACLGYGRTPERPNQVKRQDQIGPGDPRVDNLNGHGQRHDREQVVRRVITKAVVTQIDLLGTLRDHTQRGFGV